jgi:hypothetical protein
MCLMAVTFYAFYAFYAIRVGTVMRDLCLHTHGPPRIERIEHIVTVTVTRYLTTWRGRWALVTV